MPKRLPVNDERTLFQPDYEPRSSRGRRRTSPVQKRLVRAVACWGVFLIVLAAGAQMLRQRPAQAAQRATLIRTAASARSASRTEGWRGELRGAARRVLRSTAPKRTRAGARKAAARKKPRGNWVQVWATAYCPTCTVCDTGKITASGRHAFSRGLAVAARGRRVAPLGSRIYVPRFGWLPVDDTGGGVRSDQIDIRMQSHRRAVLWGRRRLRVQVASG